MKRARRPSSAWRALLVAFGVASGCAPHAPIAASAPRFTPRTAEVRAWYLQAAVARERGEVEDALRALSWVKRLEVPTSPWPDVVRGELLEGEARLDEARVAYTDALTRDPEHGRAHFALARIALARDELDQALPHLKAAADGAHLDDAYDVWVRALLREGDATAAATLLRWVTRSTPPRARAANQAQLAEEIGCSALPAMALLREQLPTEPAITAAAERLGHRCAAP